MFLFCCYTGLRYSDVVRLTNDNFYQIENKLWLIYTTVKTNVQVRLPLPLLFKGKAVKLYEKYQKRQTETLFDFSKKSNGSGERKRDGRSPKDFGTKKGSEKKEFVKGREKGNRPNVHTQSERSSSKKGNNASSFLKKSARKPERF